MPTTLTLPQFTLETGTTLRDVPVAYRTWGTLNAAGTNAVLVSHALTADTNVDDWWGRLLGPGRALDPTEDFVVCLNVPGSPYGSASPVTTNPETGTRYGPDFPAFTIRDTVRQSDKATLQTERSDPAASSSSAPRTAAPSWSRKAPPATKPSTRPRS